MLEPLRKIVLVRFRHDLAVREQIHVHQHCSENSVLLEWPAKILSRILKTDSGQVSATVYCGVIADRRARKIYF